MKKIWIALLLFATVTAALGFYVQGKDEKKLAELSTNTEKVHHHAGFQVYVDGQLHDYSDFKYMNFTPCSTEEVDLTPEEEQLQKAHLHDQTGNVVHVHRPGATWGDLFSNINVAFDPSKELVAYNAAGPIENIFEKEIEPYESIYILVGDNAEPEEYLDAMVSRQQIEAAEQVSELCGS